MRARHAMVLVLWTACACPQVDDRVATTELPGIFGTVYQRSFDCGAQGCPASTAGVRVRAISPDGQLAGEAVSNDAGHFELKLPDGTYAVELVPQRSEIDRTVGTVDVAAHAGREITRTYDETIDSHLLVLQFSWATSSAERLAILATFGLTVVTATPDYLDVLASIADGGHPQLVGEAMVQSHRAEAFTLVWPPTCPQ